MKTGFGAKRSYLSESLDQQDKIKYEKLFEHSSSSICIVYLALKFHKEIVLLFIN